MIPTLHLAIPILLLTPAAALAAQNEAPNALSRLERDAGWQLLFDGATTRGWRGLEAEGFPAKGWDFEGGCLHHQPKGGGGDIVTEATFDRFELEFEWKVAKGVNSGVKYRAVEDPKRNRQGALGPEYQILDDSGTGEANNPEHAVGALYDVFPPGDKTLRPAGEFNHSRIVVREDRIEHWLNGNRVVHEVPGSERWKKAVEESKFAKDTHFLHPEPGHILLQDHGGEVWFRDLKLRELPSGVGTEALIYDGKSLRGWRELGDARYVADGDAILGEVDGGGQSFLVTEKSYGDFIFEVDVKPELPGNSGIQIRSHQRENGRIFGYQIEIDSSDRAWSGGLYDEARRGWLQNLEHNPAGRAAFRPGEWNRYRIECVGPWIKASIDGVPTTDYFDTADIEGVFGLQVHSGNNTRVRWGRPRLWDLGRRKWLPLFDGRTTAGWSVVCGGIQVEDGVLIAMPQSGTNGLVRLAGPLHESGDATLRCRFRVEKGGDLQIGLRSSEVSRLATATEDVLACTGTSWRVVPTNAKSFKAGEWNDLSLCLDGEPITVLVGGRLAAEARGPAGSSTDTISFLQLGQGRILLRDIELLSDPEP